MLFERFSRLISYAAVLCGFASLWISGTFGIIFTGLFLSVLVAGWFLEDSSWQISERIGTALIVLALPLFYLAWKYQLVDLYGSETAVAGILARMILALTGVKILQKKSDRDWIFLYLMSFFEVLLAAGLSISPLYLVSFVLYLLLMVSAIIAFEMRKTSLAVAAVSTPAMPVKRLPAAAVTLLVFVALLAIPLFFFLPRVGGAGFGGLQRGLGTSSGFSDVVKLGGIGRIQQSDEVVMRVSIEGRVSRGLYFRGVALDTFDNRAWSKSRSGGREPFAKGDREIVQLDVPGQRPELVVQNIYLEPLDTPVLFALPRVLAVQGGFPIIEKDAYGSLNYKRNFERVNYTVLSDRSLPDAATLRQDDAAYSAEMRNYLQLPQTLDHRIGELASAVTSDQKDRYDKAAAVERYLQSNFGYTLEQNAGGDQPLSDFLFNVREGHCEYFATAMAVMLRTQGVATRIVNGFHGGDYNDAVDMTIVRQRNAHSWVEVYFPRTNTWVPFDPTPAAEGGTASSGLTAGINKYLEAIEAFWIQHFVAYDDQGQRSLVRSLRNTLAEAQGDTSSYLQAAKAVFDEWWKDVSGEHGSAAAWSAVGWALAYIALALAGLLSLVWGLRKVVRSKVWRRFARRVHRRPKVSTIGFYERMQGHLADKGMVRSPHQTPLEFAHATGSLPIVTVTEAYHAVRFGGRELTADELTKIDGLIDQIADV